MTLVSPITRGPGPRFPVDGRGGGPGGRPDRAAPLYGEDNEAILTGLLGMSAEEVSELTEQGVL